MCKIANPRIKCVTVHLFLLCKNLNSSFSTWLTHLTLRFLYILGCSGLLCASYCLVKPGLLPMRCVGTLDLIWSSDCIFGKSFCKCQYCDLQGLLLDYYFEWLHFWNFSLLISTTPALTLTQMSLVGFNIISPSFQNLFVVVATWKRM